MNNASRRCCAAALSSFRQLNVAKRQDVAVVFPLWLLRGAQRCSFSSSKTGQEHHAFFQEQMEELERERKSFFGEGNGKVVTESRDPEPGLARQDDAFFAKELAELEKERMNVFGESIHPDGPSSLPEIASADLDQMKVERESLFEFSSDEKEAWSQADFSSSDGKISTQLMQEIAEARAALERGEPQQQEGEKNSATITEAHHRSFSHVSQDGESVHMVDVGHKQVTARMAQAQTKVILPNDVLEAFSQSGSNELVGPKGPILATAKLAGIMAAKKTSELIPLCHPLPLDQVKIEIRLLGNEVIIDCTCRVTHKTGVEMEALTGASIAALTVYDMVKAVSHEVQITDTRLIAKSGGKRIVHDGSNEVG